MNCRYLVFDVYKFAPEDIRYLVSLDLELIINSNDLGIELMCWIGGNQRMVRVRRIQMKNG